MSERSGRYAAYGLAMALVVSAVIAVLVPPPATVTLVYLRWGLNLAVFPVALGAGWYLGKWLDSRHELDF